MQLKNTEICGTENDMTKPKEVKAKKKAILSEATEGVQKEQKPKKIKDKKKKTKEKKSKDGHLRNGMSNGNYSDDQDSTNMKTPNDESVEDPVKELSPEQKAGSLKKFRISETTVEKLKEKGVNYLFPIQAKTFDDIYDGKDIIGQARTGTGKTLSFALPLVEKIQSSAMDKKRGRPPKVLVMAPTRELSKQIHDDFESISDKLDLLCVYGGTSYFPQEKAMKSGIDVLIGTPGRINDHLEKGKLDFSQMQHVVLDEVDLMLDMGFADIVEKILQYAYKDGNKPQTLLFSATLPVWVQDTAKKYMNEGFKTVSLVGTRDNKTSTTVQHMAIKCSYHDRAATLGDVVQVYSGKHGRAIVFCQTKKDADELAIHDAIKQDAQVLHGDIPQEKREMVLKSFRAGKCNLLISTDVAARGLDIPEVDLVVQCNPPRDVDSYIHRSGRTGRAGRSGVCICFYKPNEEHDLQWVEKKAQIRFKRIGAPTPADIIKASVDDAVGALSGVPEETLKHFLDPAQSVIESLGAVNALSAALALISGSTKIVARSLLSSREGYITYLYRTNVEMRTMSFAWRALERQLSSDIKEKIERMRFCKDRMGCVFDLPAELESEVPSRWKDTKYDILTKATELPELEASSNSGFSSPAGGRGGGGRFGGGRGGGRGGFGQRRGGSQGGFNNRYGGFNKGPGAGFKRQRDSNGFSAGDRPQNKRMKFS